MKRARLGVSMRLGIVLTGLWLPVATIGFEMQQREFDVRMIDARLQSCNEINATFPGTAPFDCQREWDSSVTALDHRFRDRLGSGLISASIMAAFAWILFGTAYGLFRWILAGRSTPPS